MTLPIYIRFIDSRVQVWTVSDRKPLIFTLFRVSTRLLLPLWERLRSIVMSTSVCVCVCLSACEDNAIRNHMRDVYQIFMPMAVARSSSGTLWYVMYFWFCGWHVFRLQWAVWRYEFRYDRLILLKLTYLRKVGQNSIPHYEITGKQR